MRTGSARVYMIDTRSLGQGDLVTIKGGGMTVVISTTDDTAAPRSRMRLQRVPQCSEYRCLVIKRYWAQCAPALNLKVRRGNYHVGPLSDVAVVKFGLGRRCLRLHASLNDLSPQILSYLRFLNTFRIATSYDVFDCKDSVYFTRQLWLPFLSQHHANSC